MDLISEVSEELAYYIHAEKKACLPGLGCFEAVYQSAVLDPVNDILQAPVETLVFGIAKEEDNQFVQYLTQQMPGNDIYESFKQKIIALLMSDTEAALPGLGQLIANQKGEISFTHTENDDVNFDFEDLVLTPVSVVKDPAENVASNAPGAATEPIAENKEDGMSFLRIAMLAVVSALCLVIYFNEDPVESAQAVSLQVSNNFNVSPKAIQQEVYIASEGGMSERLKEKDRADIIRRQDAMTATTATTTAVVNTEETSSHELSIVTNTFGSRENADRQIERIESLGYKSATFEKGSNLISTLIVLTYTDEEELSRLLEKVKQDFPGAKLSN